MKEASYHNLRKFLNEHEIISLQVGQESSYTETFVARERHKKHHSGHHTFILSHMRVNDVIKAIAIINKLEPTENSIV